MKCAHGVLLAVCLLAACKSTPVSPEVGRAAADGPVWNSPAPAAARTRTHTDLAASYYLRGNYAVALQELRLVLDIDPRYVPAHNLLGLIYLQLKDPEQAGQHLALAMQLAPTDPDTRNNYGWLLCETGQANNALQHFDAALKEPLFTGFDTALLNAGVCALRAKAPDSAASYLGRLLERRPGAAVPRQYLAQAEYERGNLEAAHKHAETALQQGAPTPENLWLLARITRKLDHQIARGFYEAQLLKLFPGSAEARELTHRQKNDLQ